MRRLANRIRLLPKVMRLASHAPRNPGEAWERYWNTVGTEDAEILWDSGRHDEGRPYEELVLRHLDTRLPVVDVGCGNGTWTRWLAERFPLALGVDLSASAVHQAARESAGVPNAEFDAVDALGPGAGAALRERLGEANVFIRGLFHILKPEAQHRLAATLHDVVGTRGRVLLTETNFRGSGLAYIEHLGATGDHIPGPLRAAIETLPPPRHFGASELRRAFPDSEWRLLEERDVVIEAVPMAEPGVPVRIPGYCAVLAPR
ncbi:class I SAM-dependent methyltransferase [Sinomonas mesophila]|uniref:class I SAM-dependent methyltransferase n=1 Tax=Sinomonas mesophila TaxID=1531955 RepID=UPI000984139D|nr:class I SAM-dependent methyltransferase [Sinomonas mesophila]